MYLHFAIDTVTNVFSDIPALRFDRRAAPSLPWALSPAIGIISGFGFKQSTIRVHGTSLGCAASINFGFTVGRGEITYTFDLVGLGCFFHLIIGVRAIVIDRFVAACAWNINGHKW